VLGIEGDFDGADIKGSQTAFATVFTATTSTPSGTLKDTLNQSHTLNTKIDELGTLRGKIGWAWSPNWMFYGTGGLAWAHARDDFSASQTFCDFRGICRPDLFESVSSVIGGVSSSSGVSMLGWTVGAGLDYKWQLDQGSAVIFGVEYLHYQFGEHSLAFGGPLCACRDDTTFTIGNATQTIDAIKGRISYLFSIH
jgi:outer membrane immunogenic protein